MSRPDANQMNEILDQCLLRLQTGEELSAVLADYPAQSAELRPVLEAVTAIWAARGSDTVPVAAMMRSRARLMSVTRQLNTVRRPPLWKVRWSLFTGSLSRARTWLPALAGLILIAGLLFTGLASAQALPGESLYPVKIAAEQIGLTLAGSPSGRLALEETYDQRRKEEVEILMVQNREEEVHFTGFLTRAAGGAWQIDEITLTMPAEMVPQAEALENRYVYLHADLFPQGELVAEWIEPRVYLVTGRITTLETARLQVGDVWLRWDGSTEAPYSLQVGQIVRASVIEIQGKERIALKIELVGPAPAPSPTSRPVVQPSSTPSPDQDSGPGENEPPQETQTPDEGAEEQRDGREETTRTPGDNGDAEEDGSEDEDGEEDPKPTPDQTSAAVTPEPTRSEKDKD